MKQKKTVLLKLGLLFQNIQCFGLFIPVVNLVILYGRSFFSQSFVHKLAQEKHHKVKFYLLNRLDVTINEWIKGSVEMKTPIHPLPIWYCWFQGEENLPEIPALCLASIRKHSNGHPVVVITRANYMDYVQIPSYVVSLSEEGKIKAAHFADILRVALLYEYGGVWVDATVFLSKDLSERMFSSPFFSIKIPEVGQYVSRCRWSVFFLAGWKGNPIYGAVLDLFYAYLKQGYLFVDYLMMDYFIDILYQQSDQIRKMIDDVPVNNCDVYFLRDVLCEEFDELSFNEMIKHTQIFKLDWKKYTHSHLTKNKLSYYSHLVQIYSLP